MAKFGPFEYFREKLLQVAGARMENLGLSAFGKLPLYKDFIHLECQDGPAGAFRRWMEQGFGTAFDAEKSRNVRPSGPHRMFCSCLSPRFVVLASIWPSSDEGGLRQFPFSFFTVLPQAPIWGLDAAAGWPLLDGIWRRLEDLYQEARALDSIDAFHDRFAHMRFVPEEGPRPVIPPGPETLNRWLGNFGPGGAETAGRRLTKLIDNLAAAYRNMGEDGGSLAVRAPFVPESSEGWQVNQLERALRAALPKCPKWPNIILPRGPQAPGPDGSPVPTDFHLLWRPIRLEDVRLFNPIDAQGYDFVEDFSTELRRPLGEGETADPAAPNDSASSADPTDAAGGGKSPMAADAAPLRAADGAEAGGTSTLTQRLQAYRAE